MGFGMRAVLHVNLGSSGDELASIQSKLSAAETESLLTITTATDYYHKALAGESESDLEDLTPPREVLDTDEQPSAAVIEGRKKWRKEILGAGNVQWKDTDLRKAVETCRIVERVICCDKAPKEKWKRTRSEDVAMEEALRKMGDETLDIFYWLIGWKPTYFRF